MDQMTNLPPTPSPVQEVAPKGHIFIKVLVVVLVVGLLGGGGAWGYFHYYAQKPEMTIYKSFLNFEKVKTYSFDSNLTVKGKVPSAQKSLTESLSGITGEMEDIQDIEISEGDEISFNPGVVKDDEKVEEAELKLGVKGVVDVTDIKQAKQQINLNLSFNVGEKESIPPLSIDFLNDSKVVAVRVPKIPAVLDMDFSDMNNQWVSYDYSKVKEKLDALIDEHKAEVSKNFTDEDEKRLLEIAKKSALEKPPITVTKKFKKEVISGVETQPYAFTINKENVVILLETLAKDEKAGIRAENIKEFKEGLEDVKKLDGTIWLGGTEVLPYKISLAGNFQDDETKNDIKMVFTVSFADFNKPVKIEAPKDAITFEEAFGRIMKKQMEKSMGEFGDMNEMSGFDDQHSFSSEQTIPVDPFAALQGHAYVYDDYGKNITLKFIDEGGERRLQSTHRASVPEGVSVDNDSDGLEDILERLFKTDPNKSDSDGDGLSDGEEVNKYKTHPMYKDTDGDGYNDKMEIESGHDPLKK